MASPRRPARSSPGFLGYGLGVIVAARDPQRHQAWINTTLLAQALDWVATVAHLAAGDVGLRNVTTAVFLPVIFIVMLAVFHPRRRTADAPRQA